MPEGNLLQDYLFNVSIVEGEIDKNVKIGGVFFQKFLPRINKLSKEWLKRFFFITPIKIKYFFI